MIPDVRIIRSRTMQGSVEPNLLAYLVLHILRQCPTWATHVQIQVFAKGVIVSAYASQGGTGVPMYVHVWDN